MATLDRLKDFHSYLKENGYGGRNVFEREIGVSEGYLSQSKRKGINSDVLERVAERFPELSIEWLVTGRGEMLVSDSEGKTTDKLMVKQLEKELNEVYSEIGRLNMKLKQISGIDSDRNVG